MDLPQVIRSKRRLSRTFTWKVVLAALLKDLEPRYTHGPSDPPSESPNPSNQGKNSSKNSSSKGTAEEDCEFTIAADLTLYANPLRCLQKTARPASQHPAAGATEMIATDLVKYGSPLDDKPA
ncbi:uncharacterized protein LOC143290824 isoform X1 [Babylonia areolata]|uniref:uncharacterized protein LOC143290824 isoform X1 n=1 Tax=Babylonia areolata TaxID=304850 RepID=UPI003FD16F9E